MKKSLVSPFAISKTIRFKVVNFSVSSWTNCYFSKQVAIIIFINTSFINFSPTSCKAKTGRQSIITIQFPQQTTFGDLCR